MERITAMFDNMQDAESAVNDLRASDVADKQLSIVTRHPSTDQKPEGAWERTAKGAGLGASAGAVLGIAAAFIPGVGPFITAGVLTSWLGAVAGGAASGAVVGGAAGAIGAGLQRAGYDKEAAEYYAQEVEKGGVLVAVDVQSPQRAETILASLARHGGRTHEVHVHH